MRIDFQGRIPEPSGEGATVIGRSRMGRDIEELAWGDAAKSIVFLSGFGADDKPVSETLLRWKNHLDEADRYGGILGDFDLKNLRSKCRIRMIPVLNPDCCKINQNGIYRNFPYKKISLEQERNHETISDGTKNIRGVDLNRNFNAKWLQMKSENPNRDDFGAFPESEVETASLTGRMRKDLPSSAIILRSGNDTLIYPEEATAKELQEATFLGQYGRLSVRKATDTGGTALQWFTDRGVKAVEIRISDLSPAQYTRIRNLLMMCAALT